MPDDLPTLDLTSSDLLVLTADIVGAHVSNNAVGVADLPGLIISVHGALSKLGDTASAPTTEPEAAVGVVSARKSLASPDHIISMIDGKPYAMLRRHLTTQGMTPEAYRAKFGLKADYPMVAPAYAAKRRALAVQIGLGRKAGAKSGGSTENDESAESAPKALARRGRKPKVPTEG